MVNNKLRYTVIGLGSTGISCVDFLQKNNCFVSAVDTRKNPPNFLHFSNKFPEVPVVLGSLQLPPDTEVIVISPGLSSFMPPIAELKAKGIPVIGDIELFAQAVNAPVVAVTGSNGKSTVVTILSKMAEASGVVVGLGGNIGVSALSLLEKKHDLYILELSSFQLETTYSLAPKVATILNVSPDHLDRHADMAEYHNAKLHIYNNAKHIIINRKDPYTFPTTEQYNINSFGFDLPTNGQYGLLTDANETLYLAKGREAILPVSELKMVGEQNILNALAALALADVLKLPLNNCISVLKTFVGLPHRCEFVGKFNEVVWINDSKGTNVGAAVSAIAGVATQITGKLIVILGGISKGADFTPLVAPVLQYCKAIIVIGEAKKLLKKLFVDKLPCYEAYDMNQCITLAKEHTRVGDGVLLSPACSSLDMFTDFQARGLAFKQAVFDIMEVK